MTLQVLAIFSLLSVKIPSNVLLMQDSYNNLVNFNFIPKELIMEKIFDLVPSLEVLADDSLISIYAKESLGVGNPNMILNLTIVGIPLVVGVGLAMLLLLCAVKLKVPYM